MAATYVHLSGRGVDNALLKLQGLVQEDGHEEEKIKVKGCQRCKMHNSPMSKYCTRCGLPLDENLVVSLERDR